MLRVEERLIRMQARAIQGLGRGGGYFERCDASDRVHDDKYERGVDEFGRRRFDSNDAEEPSRVADAVPTGSSSGSGPRNGLTSGVPAPPSKAERQKAALERLRNPKKRETSMSPPRNRVYREKTSRSRSREARKARGSFIFGGGLK